MEELILVNEKDEQIGVSEKMNAHRLGLLHRAFSVFIFNSKGEILLQQRASTKYHSGGLWANACCSHPKPGETVLQAAERRVVEELNLPITDFKHGFSFIYNEKLNNELTEHELDHIVIGKSDSFNTPNPEEVQDVRFWNLKELDDAMTHQPHIFSIWFIILYNRMDEIKQLYATHYG